MNAQRERAVLNEDIQGTQLRLIGADGSQVGIVSRVDALDEAQKAGLDLVLIAPEAENLACQNGQNTLREVPVFLFPNALSDRWVPAALLER